MSVEHVVASGLVCLSGNPIQIITWASGSKLNHKLLLKITCSALFGSPFIDEIAPDEELTARFDISGYVDQPVDYEFDYPPIGKVAAHTALAFMVTINIGESWTDTNGDRQESWENISENNVIRVIKGKLRPYELAVLNDISYSFANKYIDQGLFLTHLPQNMKVSPTHPVKLWLLSQYTSAHTCFLNFQVETDDKVGHLPIQEATTLYPDELFEFSMNPEFMGYHVSSGAHVIAYTFWLSETEDGPDITERRRFVVNNDYHENEFTFLYVNPLSGVDSIWLTGRKTEGLKTEIETAYKSPDFSYGTKTASLKTTASTSQRTWSINTGFKDRDEILALRDFLEAADRWMVDPDNTTKLIPVIIESEEFTLYDDDPDYIPNLTIKILEAHR